MSEEGNFRKYLHAIKQEIISPSKFLIEQSNQLEEAIQSLRLVEKEEIKERLAENLMIQTARYLCSLLYERALLKIKDTNAYKIWEKDCKAYLVDSTAIAKGCLYRIQNTC